MVLGIDLTLSLGEQSTWQSIHRYFLSENSKEENTVTVRTVSIEIICITETPQKVWHSTRSDLLHLELYYMQK